MGLGLAVVSREGEVFYANLWLPARFLILSKLHSLHSTPLHSTSTTSPITTSTSSNTPRFTLLYSYLGSLLVVALLLGGRRVVALARACRAGRQQTWRK